MSDDYARAMQVALRYLSFRPRSVAEVRRRVGRDFPQPAVEQTLTSLQRYGYLDDAEFAVRWRDSRERRRPKGAFLLRRELRAKGIAEAVIDEALADMDEDGNAYRAGQRQAQRWLDGPPLPYADFRRKMGDYLRRRGFPGAIAHRTATRFWQERNPDE